MTRKHVKETQLYYADKIGIMTVETNGQEIFEELFTSEITDLEKKKNPCRFTMAVSADEAAVNIKYKTAAKIKCPRNCLELHFAPYPGTDEFPADAEAYNEAHKSAFEKMEAVIMDKNLLCDNPVQYNSHQIELLKDAIWYAEHPGEIKSRYNYDDTTSHVIFYDNHDDTNVYIVGEIDDENKKVLSVTLKICVWYQGEGAREYALNLLNWKNFDMFEKFASNPNPKQVASYLTMCLEANENKEEENTMNENTVFEAEVEAINKNDKELAKIEKIIVSAGGAFAHLKGKVFVMNDNGGIRCEGDIAIEVARKVWAEAGKIFDPAATTTIRTSLKELFYNNKEKQETTETQQSDTVENKPVVNNAVESAAEKEENKMNDVQGRETQVVNPYDEMVSSGREPDRTVILKVFAMYNGKKGYVNRTTTFWSKEPDFYVGNVFKNGVKVGSWTWNLEFKYPQYKPVAGSLGGDGSTAYNYAYPSDMKKMATNEERVNRTNCNGYLVAITVALAKVGIKTKYQPKNSNYGASVMDSSGPAPRTVTGRTHKKPEEPVIVNTGIDENDLAFYE